MKKYINPEPLQYQVELATGEVITLRANGLTAKKLDEINEIETDQNMKPGDRLINQMVIFFGGVPDDYKDLDVRVMKQIFNDMRNDIVNPTTAHQKA